LVTKKPLDQVAGIAKCLEDNVIAPLCLFAALPLPQLISLAIKLDSPGSELRVGSDNPLSYKRYAVRAICGIAAEQS
jgi:hypothetical protein